MDKASDKQPPETIDKHDLLFELRANWNGNDFVGKDMRRKADEHYGKPQPWPRHAGEKTTKPTFKTGLGNK